MTSQMNLLDTIAVLVVAFLTVFIEASFNIVRDLLGAQIDLLPALVVYASLSSGMLTLALVSVWGGLWYDSLSVNPLGVSVIPLFLVGLMIYRSRDLILREMISTQLALGLVAGAVVPLLTLALVVNTGAHPMIDFGSLWQWLVMAIGASVLTPVMFLLFDPATPDALLPATAGDHLPPGPPNQAGPQLIMLIFDQLNKEDRPLRLFAVALFGGCCSWSPVFGTSRW